MGFAVTYKLAIIYDVSKETADGTEYGWAYFLRAKSLQKYAPPDFSVDIFAYKDVPWSRLDNYDCWLNLEYAAPVPRVRTRKPWIISFNSDSRRRRQYFPPVKQAASYIVFNNQEAFDYYGRPQNSCCISNGIDMELWYPETVITERPHRLLWCGSSGPTKGKGYAEIFQPLEQIAQQHGFETDFRPINDINEKLVRPYAAQRAWYSGGSYVLCASASEGTPGYFTEGVACGCVGVGVPVGNVLEWGRDRENCVLCERTPEAFIEALRYAREHRERLSAAGQRTIGEGWYYGEPGRRAAYFFNLFRRIIEGKPPKPFSYMDVSPEDI